MTSIKFDYKIVRAEIFIKYAIDLDETSISILYVLLDELKQNAQLQNAKIDEAAKNINTSSRSLQVDWQNPQKQAFWFGMGKWGGGFIIAVITCGLIICYNLSIDNEKDNFQKQLHLYQNYYQKSEALKLKRRENS